MKPAQQPPPCPGCNGTGQMTWFGGVSRFQFSYEDCPECNGVGFLISAEETLLSAGHIACGNLSHEEAERFLDKLAQVFCASLAQGEEILLRGFGSFRCVYAEDSSAKIRFNTGKKLFQKLNEIE